MVSSRTDRTASVDARTRTKRILLVLSTFPIAKTPIIFSHPPIYTIPESLVHLYRNIIRASHIQIDEERFVGLVRDELEQRYHPAGEREAAVFRCDGQRGDVSVPFRAAAFSLSDD